MTAALLLAMLTGFTRQEIVVPPAMPKTERSVRKKSWGPHDVHVAGLTDGGVVGGFTTEMRGNGASTFAIPFVWKDGRGYRLPMGGFVYGHVRAVRDDVVVGDVRKATLEHPAFWYPHPTRGWSAPRIEVMRHLEGWAVGIDGRGEVWIRTPKGLRRRSGGPAIPAENVDFAGVDGEGCLYGSRFGSLMEGIRMSQQAVRFEGGKWNALAPTRTVDSSIIDVNRHGVAVGTLESRPGIWRGGRFTPILRRPIEAGRVADINDAGEVVGCTFPPDLRVFMWRNGEFTDLNTYVSEVWIQSAEAINERGQIVVSGASEGFSRFYLLTPRATPGRSAPGRP